MYSITERVEMGAMAGMIFHKYGVMVFYLSIILYLYGDMAIYCVAIPKSLRNAMCTYHPNHSYEETDLCWPMASLTRHDVYMIDIAIMAVLLCPFVFTDVQKSKYLQGVTSVVRWLGLIFMVVLGCLVLAGGRGTGVPSVARLAGVPSLFGVCVYSFMCHHSLPSILTPIKNKKWINTALGIDYTLILGFYALLSFTAIYTTKDLQDLYTLNFLPPAVSNATAGDEPLTNIAFFQYFLALFPVLTLGSSFPIIGITLRNNLKTLFMNDLRPFHWIVDRIVFPIVVIIPPFILAFFTMDVNLLVAITGSYPGSIIQYIVPATLVYCGRKMARSVMGTEVVNKHTSFFKNSLWVWFVIAWSVICMVFVTVNHIIKD